MYNIELPVKPLEALYLVDDRTEKDGGYKPCIKEFIVCHYIILADHIITVDEYGHKITLKLLGKTLFTKREDAENKLAEILKK